MREALPILASGESPKIACLRLDVMNSAIEWHDSELIAINTVSAHDSVIVVDAYVHRSVETPGVSRGEGGIQRVRINMRSVRIEGDAGELPATIYDGTLGLGGEDGILRHLHQGVGEACG